MPRKVPDAAVNLIASMEGCSLTAYPDPVTGGDPWTIGYSHTEGVWEGEVISQEQADYLLADDIDKFAIRVDNLVGTDIPTTANQFGAMVSLAYNIGIGNFARSSVLRYHRNSDYTAAAMSFPLWNKAAGRVYPGLVRRRHAEARLYMTPDGEEEDE